MKQISKYLYMGLALASLSLASCDKEEVEVFDPNYAALNVWFGTENSVYDNVVYNYSYSVGEKPLSFYARVSGMKSDHDRTFTLEAVGGDLDKAEGSYRTSTYTIPAGETLGTFEIYFDTSKLKNAAAFSEEDGEIVFKVVANNEFAEGANNQKELHVVLRNYLSKPDNWDTTPSAMYPALRTYFGDYSKTKYSFIIEHTGLVDFQIYWSATKPYDEATNTISRNYATYLQQFLRKKLAEYNETHDTPLTDEYGNPVTF